MSFDTLRNTAQPAFQAGRSAATTPITSTAVSNPGGFPPGPAGVPPGLSPQGSVAPGGIPFQQQAAPPGGAFAPQTQSWAAGGNPAIQAELMQTAMGQAQASGSTLGSAMGAFAGGRGSTSPMMAPMGRFGGK